MSKVINLFRRYPLTVFFTLAYLLSWWPMLIEAHAILPLGPLFAALIVLVAGGGWAGVANFLRRIGCWRVGPRWYALVLLLPAALLGAAVGLNVLLGARTPTFERMPALSALLPIALDTLVFVGLGEEPAWRGFALPRLTERTGMLAGTLILAALHIIWHLPLFGLEYTWANLLPWALGVTGYAIVATWVYNRTQGSLLLPILFHTSVNISARYMFNPLFSGVDLLRLWWLWGGIWVAAATVVELLAGRDLAGAPRAVPADPAWMGRSIEV